MNTAAITLEAHDSDYLDTTAVFGEVKKTIISKDFKGGKITNVFGETVLDFTNADISGVVLLDISQAFGEISLTVPANWQVATDISQFLPVTRDNRDVSELKNAKKVLLVTGNSVFAAVKITNGI